MEPKSKPLLYAIALCLLATGTLAFPLNLSANVSLNITDGNGTLVWPGGNQSFNSTENQSILQAFNLTVDYPELVNLSLNLSRAEVRNLSGYYDNLTLTCANDSFLVYNETFNISRNIHRGETIDETVGACNLHLSCSGTCSDNQSYQVDQSVSLVKEGNLLTITSQNNTKTFSLDVFNSSDTITLSYYCPNDINTIIQADNETQLRVAYDFCQAEFPYLNQWLNLTLNRCSDNWEAYRDFVKTHNEGVIAANQELSNVKAYSAGLEKELELKNMRVQDLEDEVQDRDDRIDGRDIILSIMAFIIICELAVIFIIRNSGEEVGS